MLNKFVIPKNSLSYSLKLIIFNTLLYFTTNWLFDTSTNKLTLKFSDI